MQGVPKSELNSVDFGESRQVPSRNLAPIAAGSRHRPIHELFEEQVQKNPESVALIFGNQQLSYRTLNEKANRFARYLRDQGVASQTLAGVCMRRSLDLVIALLGILKAGGAYVPLDPDYPSERLAFMLEDTQAPVLLTESSCAALLPPTSAKLVLIDSEAGEIAAHESTNLGISLGPQSLAYIMYTSGSMGRPKGVMIEHRGIARLVKGVDYVSFDTSHRFLLLAPISFDASTFEIWGPLLNGATLIVAASGTLSLAGIGETINRFGVTTLWLTAGLFNLMIDQCDSALWPLRQLLTGGAPGSVAHFRKAIEILPHVRVINGYGPTEATTFAVCLTVRREHLTGSAVPIGHAIVDGEVVILDRDLNEVSLGEVGELCIGGEGIARGYLNQPDLTAEKFVMLAQAGKSPRRLYRTGDLARLRADGTIEFLGRLDEQVKISGYRIEPGEVSAALRQHPKVSDAAVVAQGDASGGMRLVAYVVPRSNPAPEAVALRQFLTQKLPQFMIPAAFMSVESLPLTPNGKLDRAALRSALEKVSAEVGTSANPRGLAEETVAGIWCEVLGLSRVGIHDSFFDLGGDSLQLIEVHSRLQKSLGSDIPITDVFQYPTVAHLAEHFAGGNVATQSRDDFDQRVHRQRELLARRTRSLGRP